MDALQLHLLPPDPGLAPPGALRGLHSKVHKDESTAASKRERTRPPGAETSNKTPAGQPLTDSAVGPLETCLRSVLTAIRAPQRHRLHTKSASWDATPADFPQRTRPQTSGVFPEGEQRGRVRRASGEGGRKARCQGCLGRRSTPGTWRFPRSLPPRAPLAPAASPRKHSSDLNKSEQRPRPGNLLTMSGFVTASSR